MNATAAETTGKMRRMLAAGLVAALAAAGAACHGGSELSPTGPSSTASSTATTPAVSGTWTGTALQPNNPGGERFEYSAVLVQSGSTVSGTATTERTVGGQRYYVRHSVSGSVTGMGVEIRETGILEQRVAAGVFWCSKTAALTLGTSRQTMSGSWTAPGCLPGTIALSK